MSRDQRRLGRPLCALLLVALAGRAGAQVTPAGPPPTTPPQPLEELRQEAQVERLFRLSLNDVLRIALRNNFDLVIEQLATEEARYDALGSWGSFDPVFFARGAATESESEARTRFDGGTTSDLELSSSLHWPLQTGGSVDLQLDHRNSKTDNEFASFDVATSDVLTVALTQPLLRGAWKRYATTNQRASEIALERQQEREREVQASLLLDVYNAYWDLVSAQEELAVREAAVDLGEQQLAQDKRRLEVGAGTEVDVLQSETNVAQQEELRVQADYAVIQARDNLRRLLSPRPEADYEDFLDRWDWPIETTTPLPEVDENLRIDWRVSLARAVEQRPELAQRRLDVDAAEIELTRARSDKKPQLDLGLSSSGAGLDADPQDAFEKARSWDFPSSTAALTFSVPIWNRTARYAERAARSAVRGAMIAYDRNELDVLADVRTSVNEVGRTRESVAAAIKSRTLAQRQLQAEETRQEVGLSTTFQVLQFQEDLAQAASTEVAARAGYAKALAKLAHAEGRLGEDIVEAEPTPTPEPEARNP